MKVETILTIAAQCDRAARDGTNEDNCLVVSPVGCENPTVNHFGDVAGFSEVVPLRDKGCLLVVADGMGGMNAGEVASHLAVTTLAKCFSETGLKNVELTDNAIRKFLRKSIVTADEAIKKAAAKDKEKEGMGTTVVLLWILPDNTAYYAWCGDSRLYRYSADTGLQTLSRDHSYVMEVLHLSEEEAFVHPNNNIITRSLGNPSEKANPEIEGPFPIYKDDLFLLCSDGLCGVLPSQKIDENIPCIEDILEEHIPDADHLIDGLNELWTAAAAAGWHDNVTTLLCQVKEGPKRPAPKKKPKAMQTNKSNTAVPPVPSAAAPREKESDKKRSHKDTIIALVVVALVFCVAGSLCLCLLGGDRSDEVIIEEQQLTSISSNPVHLGDTGAGEDSSQSGNHSENDSKGFSSSPKVAPQPRNSESSDTTTKKPGKSSGLKLKQVKPEETSSTVLVNTSQLDNANENKRDGKRQTENDESSKKSE